MNPLVHGIDERILLLFRGLGNTAACALLLNLNIDVIEIVGHLCVAYLSQIEGNGLHAVSTGHASINRDFLIPGLPTCGEVGRADTSPVLVLTRIIVCLSVGIGFLAGLVVEGHMHTGALRQSFRQHNPELGIPIL